jgi:hypothetical protein
MFFMFSLRSSPNKCFVSFAILALLSIAFSALEHRVLCSCDFYYLHTFGRKIPFSLSWLVSQMIHLFFVSFSFHTTNTLNPVHINHASLIYLNPCLVSLVYWMSSYTILSMKYVLPNWHRKYCIDFSEDESIFLQKNFLHQPGLCIY